MNKLNKISVQINYIKIALITLFIGTIPQLQAQERTPIDQGTKYILADVEVTGKLSYNQQTVVTFAGLEKGQNITVPGEEISNAIKKLGKLGLFTFAPPRPGSTPISTPRMMPTNIRPMFIGVNTTEIGRAHV